jgi:DNA topoisomerase-1
VATRDKKIVVVPAMGHLYAITSDERANYPIFDFKWVPLYLAKRNSAKIRNCLQVIEKLARKADTFIDACDYDLEGCLIGYCILRYACHGKEKISKRMKFSTLTKKDIEESYENPLPHLDFSLIEAAKTRHEVDWLYGINLSRALMSATRNAGRNYTPLSAGRVQSPTLKFLVDREEEIGAFVPIPYWKVKALVEINGETFEANHEKEVIKRKEEAESILMTCIESTGEVEELYVHDVWKRPPYPFNLGSLQSEAYRLFGHTPQHCLEIAQQLYLKALISYPRTDSQKLPESIDYRAIFGNLRKVERYERLARELLATQRLVPNEGNKSDPAHPAIYPTGRVLEKALKFDEERILDLVIRRFFAVFGETAKNQNLRISIETSGHRFSLTGSHMLSDGWTRFYKPYFRIQDVVLPSLKRGQTVNVKKVFLESLFTEPPSRYNPSSLLRKMEQMKIGTKATRASVIQTLQVRRYIEGNSMKVTTLGSEVCHVLQKNCPSLISTRLTRELEARMANIQEKRDNREKALAEAVGVLKPVLENLKQNEKEVGLLLAAALKRSRLEERAISACPVCKSGRLLLCYSRKTRKRFVGCSNYFRGTCRVSFSIPQKGVVRASGRTCIHCGWPTFETGVGKRKALLCFNAGCLSRAGSK